MLLHRERTYTATTATEASDTQPIVDELALRRHQGQTRPDDVLSALPWRAAILNQDGVIVDTNDAWRRVSFEDGAWRRLHQSVGLGYMDMGGWLPGLAEEHAREAHDGIGAVLAGRRALFVLEYPNASLAERRWSQLIVSPLPNGQPGALIQHLDITARKVAELARDEAQTRERAADETVQRMEFFMAAASHEIRTPLAVMKKQLHLIGQQLGDSLSRDEGVSTQTAEASVQDSLDVAQRAANMLTGLLDDFLQVTLAKEGKLTMHPVWCDLDRIVREQVNEQRQTHPSRRIHLRLDRRRHAYILADPVRIREVLTNYLNNACRYSPEPTPIQVEVRIEEDMARVLVRDQGPGLSTDAQARVWERYYQAPDIRPQRDDEVGLGLGLHLSRLIVEQHGGSVGVESAEGKGATFWYTLPLPHMS